VTRLWDGRPRNRDSIRGRGRRFIFTPESWPAVWSNPLLFGDYWGSFPRNKTVQACRLSTHSVVAAKLRKMEQYPHSHVFFYGLNRDNFVYYYYYYYYWSLKLWAESLDTAWSLSVSQFVLRNSKAQETIVVVRFSCWNAAGTLFFYCFEIDPVYPQVWHLTVLCMYLSDTKHTLNSTPWRNFCMTVEVSVVVRMKNTVQCNMMLYSLVEVYCFLRNLLPLPSGSKEKNIVTDPSETLVLT